MKCIICILEKEKLFKNNTCSFSCNATLRNRIRVKEGEHNFKSPKKVLCENCNRKFNELSLKKHQKICQTPNFCKNCNLQIKQKEKFCGKSCAAIFNNKERIKNGYDAKKICKIVELKCNNCNDVCTVKNNISKKNILCKNCQKKDSESKMIKELCGFCNTSFFKKHNSEKKYCSQKCLWSSDYFKNICVLAGQASAVKRLDKKRGQNEMYFAKLCKENFNNVLENTRYFNGWDADIILLDLKIAILWNGIWHYEKVTKNHSLLKVQNRDKIKKQEIEKVGFYPYIIKDLNGRLNQSFVEEKFNEFKEFLKTYS